MSTSPPPAMTSAPKKRQYAPGENQVYYGAAESQQSVDAHVPYPPIPGDTPAEPNYVDLMSYPPHPRDLHTPRPEIRLRWTPSPPSIASADQSLATLYQSPTLRAVPKSEPLHYSSKIPLGLVISPYRGDEESVPVIEDGIITRCRGCKAYLNPYVQFIDGGSRWRCSLCGLPNDTLDWNRGAGVGNGDHIELTSPVVEFVATAEYTNRAPAAPAYVFLLDVSQGAITSGFFQTTIRTISENLDNIPAAQHRTKVALVCYDSSLNFFVMTHEAQFSMLVISDLEETSLPRSPEDLLVNLSEFRPSLEALLDRLPTIFANPHTTSSALGPALESALAILASTGGKIILLSASPPRLERGALDFKADAQHDTQKEPEPEKPAAAFYHAFATSCIEPCVSVDMFLAGKKNQYIGLATLSLVPHYTSGQTFYYPNFDVAQDAVKFAVEFGRVLAMPCMLEAEMRVRCSKGIAVKSMHGNFFSLQSDRVIMPTVPVNQSYAVELQIEETLMEPIVVFQTAVLHTTSSGERRIRVLNLALPTTSIIQEVFASADVKAATVLVLKQTVQRTSSALALEVRRQKLAKKVADACEAYATVDKATSRMELRLPENLRMFPILMLGAFKKLAIHADTQTVHDVRAYARVLFASASPEDLIQYIYPDIYSLHNMPPEVGFVGNEGIFMMPSPLPLTGTWWERHGLYLINDGQIMYLVVAPDAVPLLIQDVFGVGNYGELKSGKMELPELDTAISQRITAIIGNIREHRDVVRPTVYVVKDDATSPMALRNAMVQNLIHDHVDGVRFSYRAFLSDIAAKINAK
ncbi:protein transporter SEC24, partial [Favolaschia claudopus]